MGYDVTEGRGLCESRLVARDAMFGHVTEGRGCSVCVGVETTLFSVCVLQSADIWWLK